MPIPKVAIIDLQKKSVCSVGTHLKIKISSALIINAINLVEIFAEAQRLIIIRVKA